MTTPLILAIEPDRRQASRLTAIADRLSVRLALVESAAGALEVLDNRLPDLILTPALLSRRDDLALTDRLRELGEAAAHIQTLTIPMLVASEPPSRGGMLSALRREHARMAGPAGCEAEIFAEQIAVYLKAAVAARPQRTEFQTPAVDETATIQSCAETVVLVEQDPQIATESFSAVEERTPDDRIFFDPEQYRFAALLAKLDEIAAEP